MKSEIDKDWPNVQYSQLITIAGIRWHAQLMGQGPKILMLHGTGASAHSWAHLATRLSDQFTLLCIDLPGHGYTDLPMFDRLTLPYVAAHVSTLLKNLEFYPDLIVGHSAGAAVMVQMCTKNSIVPRALISINGALLPIGGIAGQLFSPAAKLLANLPLVDSLFVRRAKDPNVANRMIAQTGSKLSAQDVEWYRRLLRSRKHVKAALHMMANWDVRPLRKMIPQLECELHLIACQNDKTVPQSQSQQVSHWNELAKFVSVPELGHLGHEENPEIFDNLIRSIARAHKLIK